MSGILEVTELGMINDMQRLNTISNNLANTSTVGFKRQIPVTRSFDATISQQLEAAGLTTSTNYPSGIGDVKNVLDPEAGPFKFTGNNFDVAIEGEGFLEVSNKAGVFYTRSGALTIDASGRLTTTHGDVVNSASGEIRITSGKPRIDKQGRIWEDDKQVGQLKVVKFEDAKNLQKVAAGLYSSGQVRGEMLDSSEVHVRQGYLESSNVVMMNEMVQMMETMRHFETSQLLIKSYDDLLDNAIRTLGDY